MPDMRKHFRGFFRYHEACGNGKLPHGNCCRHEAGPPGLVERGQYAGEPTRLFEAERWRVEWAPRSERRGRWRTKPVA